MPTNVFDVAIVGGGPAGAACAYRLASGGPRVVVFDAPRARGKVCGGCLSAPAWDAVGRPEELSAALVRRAVFEWDGRRAARAVLPVDGDGVVVPRDRLDAWLLARAEAAGATLIRRRVERFQRDQPGWTLRAGDRTVRADVLVGADGCRSIVRAKLVRAFRPSQTAFGVGATVPRKALAEDLAPAGSVRIVFFGRPARPGGGGLAGHRYAYAFGGRERVALGAWGRPGGRWALKTVKSLLAGAWARGGDLAPIRLLGRSTPCMRVGAEFDRPCGGDGWILVGDAAGHVNALSGEGVRYALAGGRHAAEAILAGRPRSYRDRWRADYGETLRWAARLVVFRERTEVLPRLIARASHSETAAQAALDLAFTRRSYRSMLLEGLARYSLRRLTG
jgi:geranylgeranyl reductase